MIILDELKIKLINAIDGSIDLTDFCQWYEDWYGIMQDEKLSEPISRQLENLYTDIGFYEPNESIRIEHSSYYGDEKLLLLLKETLRIVNHL